MKRVATCRFYESGFKLIQIRIKVLFYVKEYMLRNYRSYKKQLFNDLFNTFLDSCKSYLRLMLYMLGQIYYILYVHIHSQPVRAKIPIMLSERLKWIIQQSALNQQFHRVLTNTRVYSKHVDRCTVIVQDEKRTLLFPWRDYFNDYLETNCRAHLRVVFVAIDWFSPDLYTSPIAALSLLDDLWSKTLLK